MLSHDAQMHSRDTDRHAYPMFSVTRRWIALHCQELLRAVRLRWILLRGVRVHAFRDNFVRTQVASTSF